VRSPCFIAFSYIFQYFWRVSRRFLLGLSSFPGRSSLFLYFCNFPLLFLTYFFVNCSLFSCLHTRFAIFLAASYLFYSLLSVYLVALILSGTVVLEPFFGEPVLVSLGSSWSYIFPFSCKLSFITFSNRFQEFIKLYEVVKKLSNK
jgi:hypothetical protein